MEFGFDRLSPVINAAGLGLATSQFNHAAAIVNVVKGRGLPVRAAHVAIETALTESALWMYANGNNPHSLTLPHDRVGWDHGSVGLFQQQVGGAANSTANWGTTDQLMSVATSTAKFLDALGPVARWQGKSNWMACQDVQHSSFGDGRNYKANDARAIAIGNALWGVSAPPSTSPVHGVSSTPGKPLTGIYVVKPGDNLSTIAAKAHTSVASLIKLNRGVYPSLATNADVIQIGWKLHVSGAAPTVAKPKPAPKTTTYVVKSGDNLTVIARHYPSASITAASIAKANHLANPDHIEPGQRLVIA